MSGDDRTPATLTPASRTALAHYRAKAAQCRADAARWDALADELEAFGEQTEHHEGQGELL
jgi:hypothetical protein